MGNDSFSFFVCLKIFINSGKRDDVHETIGTVPVTQEVSVGLRAGEVRMAG